MVPVAILSAACVSKSRNEDSISSQTRRYLIREHEPLIKLCPITDIIVYTVLYSVCVPNGRWYSSESVASKQVSIQMSCLKCLLLVINMHIRPRALVRLEVVT